MVSSPPRDLQRERPLLRTCVLVPAPVLVLRGLLAAIVALAADITGGAEADVAVSAHGLGVSAKDAAGMHETLPAADPDPAWDTLVQCMVVVTTVGIGCSCG